jgi:hypothetical protein
MTPIAPHLVTRKLQPSVAIPSRCGSFNVTLVFWRSSDSLRLTFSTSFPKLTPPPPPPPPPREPYRPRPPRPPPPPPEDGTAAFEELLAVVAAAVEAGIICILCFFFWVCKERSRMRRGGTRATATSVDLSVPVQPEGKQERSCWFGVSSKQLGNGRGRSFGGGFVEVKAKDPLNERWGVSPANHVRRVTLSSFGPTTRRVQSIA